MKLLGTNLWNTGSLIRLANAMWRMPCLWTVLTSDPAFRNSDFFKEFKRVFGKSLRLFEAQAYDAGMMLRIFNCKGCRHTRLELTRALANSPRFQGSMGTLQMTEKREIL